MKSIDRIGGMAFAFFGILIVIVASRIEFPVNLSEPGPRLFPYISGIGMALCGIGMALGARKDEKQEPFLTKEGWKRLGIAGLALVLYYFALEWIGFLPATPFFTIAIIFILSSGRKLNKVAAVVIAVIATAALYLLFEKVFMILLPRGRLF
jgi:hypothetical protein